MWLKTEPIQLNFVSPQSISLEEMFKAANSVFSFFKRDLDSLNIGLFDTKEVSSSEAIEEFVDKNSRLRPDLTSGDRFSFDSQIIEGLEREVGADSEISLSFDFKNDVADPHLQVRLRSHLFDTHAEKFRHQLSEIGKLILSAIPNSSGFLIPNIPWRFISSYSAKTMYSEDGFPGLSKDVYHRFSDELFWYGRLARPTELMTEHGMFRSVYPYNFLCEEQIFSLKLLFESQQFPILSAGTEGRLNKRSRFTSGEQKPALPGALIPIGGNAALWCVPNEKRKPAFDILKEANLTLYRFFIDHTELFSPDHTTTS